MDRYKRPDVKIGHLGSNGYANADNVIPGAGHEDIGEGMKTGSEMEPGRGHELQGGKDRDTGVDADPQDVLKDTGTATQAERAAPLDRRSAQRRKQQGDRRG